MLLPPRRAIALGHYLEYRVHPNFGVTVTLILEPLLHDAQHYRGTVYRSDSNQQEARG